MSRIGASISGIERQLLNHLAVADNAAIQNALRIATGQRILKPQDDPTAFFQLSSLQQELNIVESATTQVTIASTVGAQSQQNLDLIRTQLGTIRTALEADESQVLTPTARLAQQDIVDAAIEEINRIAGLDIQGTRVLEGAADYNASGVNSAQVKRLEVFSTGGATTISGDVTSTATQSSLDYTGVAGNIVSDATFTLTGERGASSFSVTNGEALTDVADRINDLSHSTGITASVSVDTLTFTTVDYGDDTFVSVDVTSGTFATSNAVSGADAVIDINGVTVDSNQIVGNKASFSQNGLRFNLEFEAGFTGTFDTITVDRDNVMQFRLTPSMSEVSEFGMKSVNANALGGISGILSDLLTGRSLSGLGANTSQAIRVVDEALGSLTIAEGRADSFADITVASAESFLDAMETSLADAIDDINGVDEDEEGVLLAKNQALASNSMAALAIVQQQQLSVMSLFQQFSDFSV